MQTMPTKARLFLWAVSLLGVAVFLEPVLNWQGTGSPRFVSYLAIFAVSSCMKVWLPGITGTMSMNFVFALLGVLELSLAETVGIVATGTLAQMYWRAEHLPTPSQVSFNLSNMVIAVSASYNVYHSAYFADLVGSQILLLAISACLFFSMNTMSVAVIIGLSEQKSPLKIWSDCYLWSFPYYLLGAGLALAMSYSNQRFGWHSLLIVVPALFVLYKSFSMYFSRLEAESSHAKEMAELHLRTIEALAAAIEAKDENTHDHLERVQVYAVEMGKHLGLEKVQIQALRAASILHDIGKLAVPEHIISKPGRLTREEFEKMKIHPVVGAEILRRVGFPYPVVPIVNHHHEKWDGSGYPDGLRGEDIPIGARILSAVDCLDALASDRPYRKALPLEEAIAVVESESGKSYDPSLVEILLANHQDWEILARSVPQIRDRIDNSPSVERGEAPAAGLERSLIPGPEPEKTADDRRDFITQIASARQEVQALYELSLDLGNSLSFEETMSVLDIRLSRLIRYDTIAVYILREESLLPRYISGIDKTFFASLEIPIGEGLTGWVADNRMPILNGNPSVEAGYLPDSVSVSTLRAAMAIPLVHLDRCVGVISVYSREKSAFNADDSRILTAIAPKLAVALENVERFKNVEDSASTDPLTGLPNARSLFVHLDQEVSRSQRTGNPIGILVCDLDGFKLVNDQFGHLVGNRVLELMAQRLRSSFREYDYLARMGGDEFVAVLADLDEATIERKVEQITRIVENVGYEICGESSVSVSVGFAFCPNDGSTAENLLGIADERMYEQKRIRKQEASAGDLQRIAAAINQEQGGNGRGRTPKAAGAKPQRYTRDRAKRPVDTPGGD